MQSPPTSNVQNLYLFSPCLIFVTSLPRLSSVAACKASAAARDPMQPFLSVFSAANSLPRLASFNPLLFSTRAGLTATLSEVSSFLVAFHIRHVLYREALENHCFRLLGGYPQGTRVIPCPPSFCCTTPLQCTCIMLTRLVTNVPTATSIIPVAMRCTPFICGCAQSPVAEIQDAPANLISMPTNYLSLFCSMRWLCKSPFVFRKSPEVARRNKLLID